VLRHLPNAITISRGLCGPAVAALLIGPGSHIVAFAVFQVAIATDLLDGWVARRLGAFHPAGAWLDGLADKVLTDATWIALWWVGFAPAWLCWSMVTRDVIVLLVWVWALRAHVRWGPTAAGQTMLAFEGVSVAVLLFHGPWLDVHWPTVGTVIGGIALGLSLISLLQYAASGPEPTA